MSKRQTQQERPREDERVVATSKPMWNLVSKIVNRSQIAPCTSASCSPRTPKAKSSNLDLTSTGKLVSRDSHENTASSSQVWQSDVHTTSRTEKLLAATTNNPIGTRLSHHNMTISRNYAGYLEKVQSNVRQKFGCQAEDDMLENDVNIMIWRILMFATMKAAVHLGQDYQENARTTKNTDFENITHLFDISHK